MTDTTMTPAEMVHHRQSAGLTQEQLAGMLGMSTRALQDIENGRAKLRTVHDLAFQMILLRIAAERRDPGIAPGHTVVTAAQVGEALRELHHRAVEVNKAKATAPS